MAINNQTLQDEDSTYSDWIEVFNGGSLPVNLNGWFLSDDADNYSKWPFPAITIDPYEYIVIFASGKNRISEKDKLHTNFRLSGSGEFLALSNPGASLYNSVFSPAYPQQYDNISYTYYNGSYIYSSIPTPGAVNDSGLFVLTPKFSKPHDFYGAPFKLALSSEQKEADIYYTTDASTPGISNGILYSDSIEITRTTVIRAIAVIDGTATSASSTRSYIFPEDVFSQFEDQPGYPDTWLEPHDYMIYFEIPTHYGMNQVVLDMEAVSENIVTSIKSLPIVSIVTDIDHLFSKSTHTDSGGIYMYSGEPLGSTSSLLYHLGRGWERSASVEYFNSNEQDGSLDFQENCGIRIHGGASRSTRKTLKRSFKIGFKGVYGPTKLRERVFGNDSPDRYDWLVLRGGFDERLENQVVDPWVKSTMRDMGHYAARSKFVHLYLNGMYWGMYNLSEQMDENCMRDNLGGSADDYDIIKDYYEVEAGDTIAWDQLIALADDPANYQVLLGNHPDGTPDPSNEKLLNPENLIDYIINIVYNNPWDWDNHNWVAARRRTNSEGFHFLPWDAESGLSDYNKIDWVMGGGYDNRPSGLFFDLMHNQEFRDLFISRVNKSFFEGGALTPDPGLKRYKKWLDELDTALIADQARWYADHSDIWNISHHTFIYDYFPGRTETVFNQFIDTSIYPRIEIPEFN
ncbi:MAG: CotH kinase family protein, partial [Bacteroidales bacterium]